jgi:hypothetical protein
MADIASIMEWTFSSETTDTASIDEILIEGEHIAAAYKTIRDIAAVTNKRIIIADKQGMTGKKVEIYSIPFKSIHMYSSENGGGFLDFNAELQLWTKSGMFKLNLDKSVDIRKLDRLIASQIL